MRVLVIESGAEGAALARVLEPECRVTLASSTGEWPADEPSPFDAVVLGLRARLDVRAERCRRLRDDGYAGGIVAACADATEGGVLLEAGADDFVTEPVEASELVMRLVMTARRAKARSRLQRGPVELDRVRREVRVRGRSIALTSRECEILACLLEAGGGVVSRASLRERVWPRKKDPASNLVEVHLSRLRDKLGDDAARIQTVRGAGYRLRR